VTLGPNLGVFPLEQTRHVGVAKSERPMLTNGEIKKKCPSFENPLSILCHPLQLSTVDKNRLHAAGVQSPGKYTV